MNAFLQFNLRVSAFKNQKIKFFVNDAHCKKVIIIRNYVTAFIH